MKNPFKLKLSCKYVRKKHRMNMIIPEFIQASYVKKSLRIFGSKF